MIRVLEADRIVGMMHITQLAWLATEASRHHLIAEIGSYRGRSTRALCDNCPGTVTAVDTWRGSPGLEDEITLLSQISGDSDWLYHEFQRNTRDCQNLEIVRQTSLRAAAEFRRQSRMFDMIFIDALHDYESVKSDIVAWMPLLSPNGLLCGHDFHFGDVSRAVRDLIPAFPKDGEGDIWAIHKGKPETLPDGDISHLLQGVL